MLKFYLGCMNSGIRDLSSKQVMESYGWIFNIDKSQDPLFNDTCWPSRNAYISNTWYGWFSSANVGSITMYMKGFGTAKLMYGNCYEGNSFGKVKVYLNSIEISRAGPGEVKEIYFDYDHNAVLKLEEDWGIIKLHSIHWNCSSKIIFTYKK